MANITVPVPDDRVPEFYTWFARWLADEYFETSEQKPPAPAVSKWSGDDEDLAEEVWAKFNDRAKALFTTLLEEPGHRFTGQELAELLDIPNGASGVAGVLAWPGRHCRQAGRNICWNVGSSQDDNLAEYWMEGVLADLFRKASGV